MDMQDTGPPCPGGLRAGLSSAITNLKSLIISEQGAPRVVLLVHTEPEAVE